MSSRIGVAVSHWFVRTIGLQLPRVTKPGAILRLEFIPWFSIVGFTTVILFCVTFGSVLCYFLTREILDHDAILTSQFINSVEWVESKQAQLGDRVGFGQLLDERTNVAAIGIDPRLAAEMRTQYHDHIRFLPDVQLANIYARDRKIIWSTNPTLIGQVNEDHALDEPFAHGDTLSRDSFSGKHQHYQDAHKFSPEPGAPFVESYIPLLDSKNAVVAVVEIYKEPRNLLQAIHRGKMLIWACIALGALFLYIVPFWIFRRADDAISDQHRRLCEAETLCVIGEMSASVAHGIRNPLAAIRSSAELALDADPDAARKNAEDIINQVDRLGKWVRELLVFSRPVMGENHEISLIRLVDECLPNFATQLQQSRIDAEFVKPAETLPPVVGNRALVNQALASIIANAIEAMPTGGCLRLELQVSPQRKCVDLLVGDTGTGMSPTQVELAFKPFYTTKHNGLGLGMAQVKRIMERFGGFVYLRSKPGQGTQACLRFPMA